MADKQYRAGEFARLAGVTVRALHHYDRVGLLKPKRTAAGYRVYALHHLERLEQIVALKFIGLPLKQIKLLLHRDRLSLAEALKSQHASLLHKRGLLDRAIEAIHQAELALSNGDADTAKLKRIIEVIEMQDNDNWAAKYYSQEAQAKIEERKGLWSPELQEQVSRQWTELFRDVEASLGKDPASTPAQALGARWKKLVEGFTGGDPQITQGLTAMHRDREHWPADMKQRMQPYSNPAVWDYIQRVFAAGRGHSLEKQEPSA